MLKPFPKIFAIGTVYIREIFDGEVEITEKVDGSQFAFGKINGTLYMRSKGCEQYMDKHDKMFTEAVEYIFSMMDKLPEGICFYCEYLKNPKHNTIAYGRIPKNHLIMFGACGKGDEFIADYAQYAELLDIETVPVIFKGKIESSEKLLELMDRESVLGNAKIEGVVVKNYTKPFLLGGQPIPLMSGKFVSEAFKEANHSQWKGAGDNKWTVYCLGLNTEARWLKAVQALRDSSQLTNEPKDIGLLMKTVSIDLEAEEEANIKEFLYKEHRKQAISAATRGLPEWYKKYLLENSFINSEDIANVETKEIAIIN